MDSERPSVGLCSQILRPYNPASWFHPVGIYKVLAKLEPRLPEVGGKLFLTFTLNPSLFVGPSLAFEAGRARLRRIFHKLRKGVKWEGRKYTINSPYCVKVEFHENGWAHFHVVFLTRCFLPGALLNAMWDFGRTNVTRIRQADFHYLLKYVTKGGSLPDWVNKRNRLRIFQSSRGFYKELDKPSDNKPSKAKGRKRKPTTIGERIEKWSKSALLQQGEEFRHIQLAAPFSELLSDLILPVAMDRRYLGNGHVIINDTQQLIPWILTKPKSPAAASM